MQRQINCRLVCYQGTNFSRAERAREDIGFSRRNQLQGLKQVRENLSYRRYAAGISDFGFPALKGRASFRSRLRRFLPSASNQRTSSKSSHRRSSAPATAAKAALPVLPNSPG